MDFDDMLLLHVGRCRDMDELINFWRGILRRENPTYWRGPTLQRRVVLEWFYSVARRNKFVGGTCAPPSALLVLLVFFDR